MFKEWYWILCDCSATKKYVPDNCQRYPSNVQLLRYQPQKLTHRKPTHHSLVNGVGSLVREYTSAQTRHHFLDSCLVADIENIVIDQCVDAEKVQIVFEIAEQPSHQGCQVNDMGWLFFLKNLLCSLSVSVKTKLCLSYSSHKAHKVGANLRFL